MIKIAFVLYVFVFAIDGVVIEEYGPIPLGFCEQLRDGMTSKIRSQSEDDTNLVDAVDWVITCEVFEPE